MIFQAVIDYLVLLLLFGGFFFLFVGVVGLLRFPDIYTRMHAMGKCDTLGTGMIQVALMLLITDLTNVTKLVLITAMIVTINPVVTHLIAKTAYERGAPMAEGSFLINDYVASQRRRKRRSLKTAPEKGGDGR